MDKFKFMTLETFENSRLAKDYRLITGKPGNRILAASKAPRTWRQYAYSVEQFKAWCLDRNLSFLPARTDTVMTWLMSLAESGRSYQTVISYLAAIATWHQLAGYSVDRDPMAQWLKGLRRLADRPRRARPLMGEDLRAILAMLDINKLADCRDGALLCVGFGSGGLRRSELVGLDWVRSAPPQDRGINPGTVRLTRKGIMVELIISKTGQDRSVFIETSTEDMPAAHYWLSAWAGNAALQPGEPVFRPITVRSNLLNSRLGDRAVTSIIRKRVVALEIAKGATREEALREADGYTGHSIRAGYGTTAALAGVQEWEFGNRMRHSEDSRQPRVYVRLAKGMQSNGLRGVGF